MSALLICPLSRLKYTIATSGSRDVLTLMMRASGAPDLSGALSGLGVERQAIVEFSDIVEPREDYILAGVEHVSRILDFAHQWDRRAPLVVHCFAGISRSPAAAYIMACSLMPDHDEARLAAQLRRLSPSATPNSHLIRLADALLGRNGRMIAAIRAIGRGTDAYEGEVFTLPISSGQTNFQAD